MIVFVLARKLKVCTTAWFLKSGASAEQCGRQVGGALCPNKPCCSQHGWCGTTSKYCGTGRQSQCSGSTPTPTLPSGGDGQVHQMARMHRGIALLRNKTTLELFVSHLKSD
ncbi:hypothetical protein Godav_027446, partial [Gossypium davidsonii]|nr:hypothetical protein [Gossypium davidsonii]